MSCHRWERGNLCQEESAHERIYRSQYGRKTVESYDEMRNAMKQSQYEEDNVLILIEDDTGHDK